MTKARAPLTFEQAIALIGGTIGFDVAGAAVDRSDRTVYDWSDPTKPGLPTPIQCVALDRAYIAGGGKEGAPILESYALQVEVALQDSRACTLALAEDIANAARESADAIAASVLVAHPGAAPAAIYRAIAESEDACGTFARVIARLKSFLPGNRADQERSGDQK